MLTLAVAVGSSQLTLFLNLNSAVGSVLQAVVVQWQLPAMGELRQLVAQSVQAGYVWVNGVGQHYRGVPYGGFKNSGVGREEGISELLSYTEEKVINIVIGGGAGMPRASAE